MISRSEVIKQIMDNAVFKKDQGGWVNHLVLTKKI